MEKSAVPIIKCPLCDKTHTIMVPTIHRNGTSARDLYEKIDAALDAMRVAQKRLVDAAPNGRDYYPQSSYAINHAIEEQERRWVMTNKILSELEEIQEHISKAMDRNWEKRKES